MKIDWRAWVTRLLFVGIGAGVVLALLLMPEGYLQRLVSHPASLVEVIAADRKGDRIDCRAEWFAKHVMDLAGEEAEGGYRLSQCRAQIEQVFLAECNAAIADPSAFVVSKTDHSRYLPPKCKDQLAQKIAALNDSIVVLNRDKLRPWFQFESKGKLVPMDKVQSLEGPYRLNGGAWGLRVNTPNSDFLLVYGTQENLQRALAILMGSGYSRAFP